MIALPSSQRARILIATLILFIIVVLSTFASSHPRLPVSLAIPVRFGSTKTLDHALNRTLGFEKILAITLPARSDHLDAIALAAAFTGLDIDIIDGVDRSSVPAKALPPDAAAVQLSPGSIGSWRAHLNALRTIVKHNISSALILEGDVDWDLRIKQQMQDYARASRMLVQPLSRSNGDRFLDPTYPRAARGQVPSEYHLGQEAVEEPRSSLYGDVDRWDVLWLGHCGAELPAADDYSNAPLARILHVNDSTVAEPQHLEPEWGSGDYKMQYSPHTRVISRTRKNVCSLAYAVTQRGARKLLYEIGLRSFTENFDLLMRYVCDGAAGRPMATCLTVQPPLFEHHRPVGPNSRVSDLAEHTGSTAEAFTINIRWSTRVNFPKLAAGKMDYFDSLKDGEVGKHLVDQRDRR